MITNPPSRSKRNLKALLALRMRVTWKKICNLAFQKDNNFLSQSRLRYHFTPYEFNEMNESVILKPPMFFTRPTTLHILNGCRKALKQGCFTWHHGSALRSIVVNLRNYLPSDTIGYADLENWRSEDNPPSTIPTSRPDIVTHLAYLFTYWS